MQLRNPEAPASSRQLSELQRLSGRSWREMDLTMQEASDWIDKLKTPEGYLAFESEQKDNFKVPENDTPFNEPQVTLITGGQRSGKTETAVAKIVDASDNEAVEKFCFDTFGIKVHCIGYDRKSRIAKVKIGIKNRLIKIPETYTLKSPLKIFCNFHLFGVPFHYCPSFMYIVNGLKSGLITDGYLVLDEMYMGSFNRESGGLTTRKLAQLSNQYAKGMLKVIMIAPLASQLSWEQRLAPTEVIETEYNKFTQQVTCHIKKKGVPGVKVVSYDGRRYRRFYWTNEKINK